MALTRAQVLAGNVNEGAVLLDEPQGVRPGGVAIRIDPDGIINVDGSDPRLTAFVRTNNDTAYNDYLWPDAIPGGPVDTFLSVNAAGTLTWQTVLPPGTRMVFFQATAPIGWTQVTSGVLSDAAIRLVTGTGGGTGGTGNFSTIFSDRTVPLPVHNHPLTDPGHQHPYNDPGHNHPLTDPTHSHVVNDPGHAHGISDPGHNHGISDPGHAHGVSDPGHAHTIRQGVQGDSSQGGGNNNEVKNNDLVSTSTATTRISIAGATTRISIRGAGTGIGIRSAGARIGMRAASTGIRINSNTTGLTISPNTTGIVIDDAGTTDPLDMNVKYANMIVCDKQ